jgi:hypothetical protein
VRVTWRGPALLGVLVLLGSALGYGGSLALAERRPGGGTAAPVVAENPSLPVDPVPDILPDPSTPPLSPGVRLVEQTVGSGAFRLTLPRPKGWDFFENSLNEWQWRPPDQPSFGYVLRVEQVLSNRRSIAWTLENRIAELNEDEQNVRIVNRTPDSLHFTYVTSNHLRHGYLRWLNFNGTDNAQVELAVTGRSVDSAGMAELMTRVAQGMQLG